ncbi:MAG: hypothetical protein MZW92_36835 [Comamonadaceae bacterium]|nr:hypothetical protein [Comamonadaceae bacterium]
MVFTYFAVPAEFQKRVLMIGILGALVLRAVMILVGAWLIAQFHWILYLFGAFLVFTGIKMWWAAGQEPDLEDNPALKLHPQPHARSRRATTARSSSPCANGVKMATPLLRGDPADRHRRRRSSRSTRSRPSSRSRPTRSSC